MFLALQKQKHVKRNARQDAARGKERRLWRSFPLEPEPRSEAVADTSPYKFSSKEGRMCARGVSASRWTARDVQTSRRRSACTEKWEPLWACHALRQKRLITGARLPQTKPPNQDCVTGPWSPPSRFILHTRALALCSHSKHASAPGLGHRASLAKVSGQRSARGVFPHASSWEH